MIEPFPNDISGDVGKREAERGAFFGIGFADTGKMRKFGRICDPLSSLAAYALLVV